MSEGERALPAGVLVLDADLLREFPLPFHPEDDDKEGRGRLLVIAGSRELAGAALLSGMAGLRAGAGKLQIATGQSLSIALSVAVPEARVIGCDETGDGCFAPSAAPILTQLAADADATVFGCGLQEGAGLEGVLDTLLARTTGRPIVLDAGALGALAPRAALVRKWQGGVSLLPHVGEMARLLERDAEEIARDPLGAAREAADHYGAVALIKGEYSFITANDGRAFRFKGGGVGLATSGSGDVLAGIVGGLCARGADPLTATLWGVWLHGEAGRSLSREVGRIGYLARELLDRIPGLLPD